MPGALDGLLVVSVEQAVAAPYCSARLADAGARVIKIERPEGDFARGYDGYVHGLSTYFVWLNRGKQSVTLDFKKAEDSALLQRLIGKADVLIQNLAPGAGELIQPWVLALERNLRLSHIAGSVLPYPTRGEASRRAAIGYFAGLASNPLLRAVARVLSKVRP